jgi:hypothetical protein
MKTMKHITLKALTATLIFCTTLGASADTKGRLAIGGDVDFLNIGQDGYCGARTTIDRPTSGNQLGGRQANLVSCQVDHARTGRHLHLRGGILVCSGCGSDLYWKVLVPW